MATVKASKKSRSKPMGLKNIEVEVLMAVAQLHAATAADILILLNKGSGPYIREALRKLAGGGDRKTTRYLYRFGMPNAPGNFRRIYTLTRRGRELLREYGVAGDWWYRP